MEGNISDRDQNHFLTRAINMFISAVKFGILERDPSPARFWWEYSVTALPHWLHFSEPEAPSTSIYSLWREQAAAARVPFIHLSHVPVQTITGSDVSIIKHQKGDQWWDYRAHAETKCFPFEDKMKRPVSFSNNLNQSVTLYFMSSLYHLQLALDWGVHILTAHFFFL